MRIENVAISYPNVQRVNAVIDRHWSSAESIFTRDKEEFIQSINGPLCIELLNGGDLWIVNFRREPNAVFYYDGECQQVACGELFDLCIETMPELLRNHWRRLRSQ